MMVEGFVIKPKTVIGIVFFILSQVELDIVRAIFSIIGLGDLDYSIYKYIFFFIALYILFTNEVNKILNYLKEKMNAAKVEGNGSPRTSGKKAGNTNMQKELDDIFRIHRKSLELYEKDPMVKEKVNKVIDAIESDINNLMK